MPWHKGRRRNDSKESEETKGRTEPVTGEPAACEPKGGACGTSADEVGDGNLKSAKRDQRGRIRTKHWRDKKEGFKGQYRCKEGAGKDTAAHQGGARKKTGTGKQFSPPNKATGPSADTIPPKYAEDQILKNQQKKSQSGRGRGASKEYQAESWSGKEKRSDDADEISHGSFFKTPKKGYCRRFTNINK